MTAVPDLADLAIVAVEEYSDSKVRHMALMDLEHVGRCSPFAMRELEMDRCQLLLPLGQERDHLCCDLRVIAQSSPPDAEGHHWHPYLHIA